MGIKGLSIRSFKCQLTWILSLSLSLLLQLHIVVKLQTSFLPTSTSWIPWGCTFEKIMVNLLIILDAPTTTFQPLATVTGRVIVENLKPLNVQTIFLKVCGRASVKFFRSSGNHTVTYKKHENYIQKKIILWTKKSDDKLPIGSHAYRFSFQLPAKCLPQFNNKVGKICYSLKAVCDIPWGLNKCTKISLNVSPTLDLTQAPQLLKPITFVTKEPLSASVSSASDSGVQKQVSFARELLLLMTFAMRAKLSKSSLSSSGFFRSKESEFKDLIWDELPQL